MGKGHPEPPPTDVAPERCLYEVPKALREKNTEAYTPKIVSIGPIHHGQSFLEAMEKRKTPYLNSFLSRTKLKQNAYTKFIKEKETKLRKHYAKDFEDIESDDFVEMVKVDAAFVIELLWKNSYRNEVDKNDVIFKKVSSSMLEDIKNDMMLLENQLPFFILEDIFTEAKLKVPDLEKNININIEKLSLIKLTYEFFQSKAYLGEQAQVLKRFQSYRNIKHFIDFFRECHSVTRQSITKLPSTLTIPTVAELSENRVKFDAGSSSSSSSSSTTNRTISMLDIKWINQKKLLIIPQIQIRKSTESCFLNMLVFEQCHYPLDWYVNDYVFIINCLVKSTKDVQLLVQSKIIDNNPIDSYQEVVNSIEKLAQVLITSRQSPKYFFFNKLCDALKSACPRKKDSSIKRKRELERIVEADEKSSKARKLKRTSTLDDVEE